jgi:hypothetical protein
MDQASDGITGIPYSHSAYLITHPTDAFFKVGVAHIATAEIRRYVMAGCQLSQLLFLSRANAHTLQSAILRTVASQFRSIDSTHPILGQDGLNGHNTSWHTNGGLAPSQATTANHHFRRDTSLTLTITPPTCSKGKGPTHPGVGPFRLSIAVYFQETSTRRFEATPNPGLPKRLTPALSVTLTPALCR